MRGRYFPWYLQNVYGNLVLPSEPHPLAVLELVSPLRVHDTRMGLTNRLTVPSESKPQDGEETVRQPILVYPVVPLLQPEKSEEPTPRCCKGTARKEEKVISDGGGSRHLRAGVNRRTGLPRRLNVSPSKTS